MAFKKGHKKIGGKKAGTQNAVTKDIKEAFKLLVEGNLDNMTGWLEKIAVKNPTQAMFIMMEMSKRFVPTLANSNIDLTTNGKEFKAPVIIIQSKNEDNAE